MLTLIDETILASTFKAHRDGDIFQLANSPLAQTPLINAYFLQDEPRTTLQIGQAVQTILRWAVHSVRPAGEQNWLSPLWRTFNVLDGFYFQRELIATLAERMAIAEQTFYDWRNTAVGAVTRLLLDELDTQSAETERRKLALMSRYNAQTETQKQVLRLLALLDVTESLPVDWLPHLLELTLTTTSPLIINERRTLRLHADLHAIIRPLVTPSEWRHWHRLLGELFSEARQPFAALVHLAQAGEGVKSAEIIITHQDSLLAQGLAAEVQAAIEALTVNAFSQHQTLWAQLQLVAGRIAEFLDSLDAASMAYAQALAAPDLLTKATAYHRRAKLMQRINLDECLTHYTVGLDLLTQPATDALQNLRVQMHIDRAWIFIQERPDWEAAAVDLSAAEALMPARDVRLRCDLYNARAGLAMRRGDESTSISNRQKAWVTASESGDISLMMKTAYNLGKDYYRFGHYAQGEPYLQQGLTLAERANDRQMVAVLHKGMGNGAFMREAYAEAAEHYARAYLIWQETGNHNWLAGVCYDSAETYLMLNQLPNARRFYEEGVTLANGLDHERLRTEYAALLERFPALRLQLNDRQERAIQFVRENGSITRRQYVDVTDVSQTQAYRDIEELVALNLFERTGSGRSTRYILS